MTPPKKTERLNIFLPKELTEELRTRVPSRRRTAFIAQALAKELHRLRLLEAIETTSGAWRAEDHPGLTHPEDVAQSVREQRSARRWPLQAGGSHDR